MHRKMRQPSFLSMSRCSLLTRPLLWLYLLLAGSLGSHKAELIRSGRTKSQCDWNTEMQEKVKQESWLVSWNTDPLVSVLLQMILLPYPINVFLLSETKRQKNNLALLQESQASLPQSPPSFAEMLARVLMALRGRTGRIHYRLDLGILVPHLSEQMWPILIANVLH